MENIDVSITIPTVSPQVPDAISTWYKTEYMSTTDADQLPWLLAQGWFVYRSVTYTEQFQEVYGISIKGTYYLQRRTINAETALQSLVTSYTQAYNEGRLMNEQRYSDLVVLYSAVLSNTQDVLATMEADDATYKTLAESIVSGIQPAHTAYAADVTGDLDDYGDSMRTQINARFDNELAKARQGLVSRGLYNTTVWDSTSSGIERERSLALSDLEDKIIQQQLGLKHKVYGELAAMQNRLLAARDRLRDTLHNSTDRRLAIRNAVVEALARFVEARTDTYPDLAEIGKLAAALGAGSPGSFSP